MSGYPNTFATFPGGNFPAADWDQNWNFAGNLGNIFCTAGGTANAIILTPATFSPTVTAYQNGTKYTFIAVNSNSGAVTLAVGSLAALACYDAFGNQISVGGTISSGAYFEAVYISSLNSNVGGFIIVAASVVQSITGITYRIVTAAGDYTVQSTDFIILMDKTVGAATNILAPASSTRNNAIKIKDYKGDAQTNHITFMANGVETIDGFSNAAAGANGISKISTNYGYKTFFPLSSGGWYVA